ncbi:MAG: divalent metal cation transporter, partial [Bryobacteraceae bacterium]
KIPLIIGVVLTAGDILLLLWFSRYGIRMIEAIVLGLIVIIGGCFLVELWMAKPILAEVASGLIPRISDASLYVAIGILGATVMPHNLYLHSALVQTRSIGASIAEKRTACRFNLIDSVVALNGALVVNAAILILAAAVFFKRSIVVTEIQQAHLLLTPLLGAGMASVLFAVALLASGQSSTLTGTMAGQIVMEGFLDLRMRPWLRRLLTRMIAIIPAVLVIHFAGEHGTYSLLILSQVVLSLQLPFAIVPLVRFTSDRSRMGEFANAGWVRVLAWASTVLIVGLNGRLVYTTVGDWAESNGTWVWLAMAPVVIGLGGLLVWVSFAKSRSHGTATGFPHAATGLSQEVVADLGRKVVADLPIPIYRDILVPLDHTDRDRIAIAHAAALGRPHGARLHLFHVEEGVTSVLFGAESSTAEISEGERYFTAIVESLKSQGVAATLVVAHGKPRQEIVRYARAIRPDLVVMGAHGHRGLKDLVYGATINAVRHEIQAPVLVVGE